MTPATMRLLVTGGTGRLGRELIPRCRGRGWEVRAISRRPRPPGPDGVEWRVADLETGHGIASAVAEVDAVVHLASLPYRGRRTDRVDIGGTERLLAAAARAGVAHIAYASIVGVDRIPWPYFRKKLEAERRVRAGEVPWSIIRGTQFHSLLDAALSAASRLPVLVGPAGVSGQPVDPADFAERLAAAIEAGPSGRSVDFGGPEVLDLSELASQWLEARGIARRVLAVPAPGRLGRSFRAGHALAIGGERGSATWRSWLERRYGPAR